MTIAQVIRFRSEFITNICAGQEIICTETETEALVTLAMVSSRGLGRILV